MVGVLLLAGCGEAGNAFVPTTEGGAAAQSTAPSVPESTMVVGTSVPGGGSVMGEPLVPRDASGSPLPQTPTVAVSSVLTSDASGRVTVTFETAGSPVEMAVGDTLELALGDVYEWEVKVADSTILVLDTTAPVGVGSTGVYKAVKPGQTNVEASGEPFCRKSNPPCGMPSRFFEIGVTVR